MASVLGTYLMQFSSLLLGSGSRGEGAVALLAHSGNQKGAPRGFGLKPSIARPVSWQRAWALVAWRE